MTQAREDNPGLRGYLAHHDAGCPSCGYNLRGVRDARCPECAMPLDLEIVTKGSVARQERAAGEPGVGAAASAKALLVLAVIAAAAIGVLVYFVVRFWSFL